MATLDAKLTRGAVVVVLTGRVVSFDEARGYGFISPEAGGREDVFLHVNTLADGKQSLSVGTRVAFQTMEGQRGLKAYDVRLIGDDEDVPGASSQRDLAEGEMCDVLTRAELVTELTEMLVVGVPSLTAGQVVEVRNVVLALAVSHEWVVD